MNNTNNSRPDFSDDLFYYNTPTTIVVPPAVALSSPFSNEEHHRHDADDHQQHFDYFELEAENNHFHSSHEVMKHNDGHHHNKKKKKHNHSDHSSCNHEHHEHDHSDHHHHHGSSCTHTKSSSKHVSSNVKGAHPPSTASSDHTDYFKLSLMVVMISAVFIAEITVGYIYHSLTLLSDAFHLFSDVMALLIAMVAIRLSARPKSEQYPFGYAKSGLIGGLVNSVFLLSACLFISLEALEGLFLESKEVNQPWTVLGVGIIGLLVNLFGLILFGGHFHVHGDEGGHGDGCSHGHHHNHSHDNMNMTAVFMHMLGDFLGSVGVIVSSSLLIRYNNKDVYPWTKYIDPLCSLFMAVIILVGTLPIVKKCIVMLLQATPSRIDLPRLKYEILETDGVMDIKELKIWELSGTQCVANLHIVCDDREDLLQLLSNLKATLHTHNINQSTIEPLVVRTSTNTVREPTLQLLTDLDDE